MASVQRSLTQQVRIPHFSVENASNSDCTVAIDLFCSLISISSVTVIQSDTLTGTFSLLIRANDFGKSRPALCMGIL